MNSILRQYFLILSFTVLLTTSGYAQMLDLSDAKIICFEKKDKLVLKSVAVLQEEIKKRTNISLPASKKWTNKSQPIIAVGREVDLGRFPDKYRTAISQMKNTGEEGYKMLVFEDTKTVFIIGHDSRGVLYGIGKLLRKMEMGQGGLFLPADLEISSTPRYPIRGHQLGYRPKTNAYDAWSVAQFDSYIRDLAIFGANSIEIMPPRTDDDFTSVHMQLSAMEMITEQSKSCDTYGMDVWMWYPNMGTDYTHPDSVQKELAERRQVFKAVPRLNALFVPGGDPGDLEPDVLFNWLQQVAEVLNQYHPQAKIWVSPQVFKPTQAWFDVFYEHVNKQYPWFGGVVFGPWVKTPIREIRKIIGPDIPIRKYPDITHSVSSQYPVPQWDLAYAITLGRECINPRPADEKMIHNALDQYAQGSISYSEGSNDDVNKFIWSDQDWDPETPVIETLRDYGRYFIGPDFTEGIAQGMIRLEKNLQGPLLVNQGVTRTLQQWQDMEKKASESVLTNARFQMGLLRAYFDAYIYRRLLYEAELEQKARDVLAEAKSLGSKVAINQAKAILSKAWEAPVASALKERCLALADSLFKSIGAQLTVEKHHAMGGRGNFIDYIDRPLNDVIWLMDVMAMIAKEPEEATRIAEIEKILQRNNPGPGGFYDNFGTPGSWARVKSAISREEDPGNLESPRITFGIGLVGQPWVHEVTAQGFEGKASPRPWMTQVTALYDQPLKIVYDNLDPRGSYTIKVAYTGRFRSRVKMVANDILVHDYLKTGNQPIYEFQIPQQAVSEGVVEFKWIAAPGERGAQVSEIWLIKN
ncbi:hypothetical protein QQ020_14925 [Fulvivirgaceae bacterium BMA12]|uniref:Alpha glucuronidase N-terminal domain-containing protein n=1 Tax=Agaribacillus aureus TaxID=3051825 RepID=A0ABT8L810_9BACT|nr:hypothetical protein [Fulvivirgaceae bacterium BMA12]